MLTTCSECGTTFRISHAHLEARRGMVRCGTCGAVFNAYDTLLPELEAPPPETELPEADAGRSDTPPAIDREERVQAQSAEAETRSALAPGAAAAAAWAESQAFAARQDAVRETAPEATVTRGQAPAEEVESTDDILLSELPGPRKSSRAFAWKAFAYGLLSLVLLLLLLAQATYFLRAELVSRMPESRPWLEAACQRIGCSIPLARDLQVVRVESSSLETDPELPAHARLHVSLSNRSRAVQAWPHVLLKLTDANNTPLAQKAFAPLDYLPPQRSAVEGIRPMSEQEIQVELDMGPLQATGYEVKLLYP